MRKFIMIGAFDALSRPFSEQSLTLCVNPDRRGVRIDCPALLTRSDHLLQSASIAIYACRKVILWNK
jgi:hypothetical protein